MAKRRSVIIDGQVQEVPANATMSQVVPLEVQSVSTSRGQRISRRDMDRTPVDPDMRTNYTELEKANDRHALLSWDLSQLQNRLVNEFEPMRDGSPRIVSADRNGEYVKVINFPLPDRFTPDTIDLLLVTTGYPGKPPLGIHALRNNNEQLLAQFNDHFRGHVFTDGYSGAEEISGYSWICYHHKDQAWRFNAQNPAQGDNLSKMLVDNFYTELEHFFD